MLVPGPSCASPRSGKREDCALRKVDTPQLPVGKKSYGLAIGGPEWILSRFRARKHMSHGGVQRTDPEVRTPLHWGNKYELRSVWRQGERHRIRSGRCDYLEAQLTQRQLAASADRFLAMEGALQKEVRPGQSSGALLEWEARMRRVKSSHQMVQLG